MKTHSNYVLRGGIKMKKIRSTKVNLIKPVRTFIPPTPLSESEIIQEEAARIYRESVMHLEGNWQKNRDVNGR